jgi:hypothetical protein
MIVVNFYGSRPEGVGQMSEISVVDFMFERKSN